MSQGKPQVSGFSAKRARRDARREREFRNRSLREKANDAMQYMVQEVEHRAFKPVIPWYMVPAKVTYLIALRVLLLWLKRKQYLASFTRRVRRLFTRGIHQ